MISSELIAYIRKQLALGTSKETIAKNLVQNGWSTSDIAGGFAAVSPIIPSSVVSVKSAKKPSTAGAKIALSALFVLVSAGYAFFQYVAQPQQPAVVATTAPVTTPVPTETAPPPAKTVTPTPVQTTPVPVVTSKPAGQYTDGSYTGTQADAYYGTVQVKATIKNGAISNVQFLQYPNDRSTSRAINSQAMPALISEAIAAQGANVNGVSGASDTSQAFIQSLSSALAQAKNS